MTSSLTSGAIVVMPDYFTTNGSLRYFSAFFAVKNVPVYLQIWRAPTNDVSGTTFQLVYQQLTTAAVDNVAVTVSPVLLVITYNNGLNALLDLV